MDLGNDSVVAARYASEHASAAAFVASVASNGKGIVHRLRSARDTAQLLRRDLADLLDHGYTPSALVSLGIPWSNLQKRFGAEALLNAGYTWPHMRASGITAAEACSIGMERLGVCADELMELRPCIEDISGMRMPLATLKQSGFTMEKLMALGLNMTNMRQFTTSLADWKNAYAIDASAWNNLGFADTQAAQRLGWCATEMHAVGMFGQADAPSVNVNKGRPTAGGWQF